MLYGWTDDKREETTFHVRQVMEVRRRWQEAGCQQDLTQFCKDVGIDRDDESGFPVPDVLVVGGCE